MRENLVEILNPSPSLAVVAGDCAKMYREGKIAGLQKLWQTSGSNILQYLQEFAKQTAR